MMILFFRCDMNTHDNSIVPFSQRVYGITTATVKVGYEYSGCSSVIWNIQTTKVRRNF